jgi:hypothetical protein
MLRVWWLYGGIGGLAVAAAAVSATEVSLRCVAVAFVVLAWVAATRARAPWTVAAACVLFAAAALVRHTAATGRSQGAGWFAYGPPDPAAIAAMRDAAATALTWELIAAGGQLGAVALLAVAVHGLPRTRQRRRTVATVVAAAVVVAGLLADRGPGVGEAGAAVRDLWPGLLAVVAAVALLVLAGRRADRRWLVAAGAALVLVRVAITQSDLAGGWLTVAALDGLLLDDAFHAVGWSIAAVSGGVEYWPALTAAVTLAGPALVVAGSRRDVTAQR